MKLKGFTLLEVLLVITIMAIAAGIGVLYTQSSQVRADVNSQVAILTSYLRLAQSNAATGNTEGFNGIHLDTVKSTYTTFVGTSYDATKAGNTTIDLPPTMTIENVSLNGGGVDIIFLGPNGETASYGTFDIRSEQIDKTLSITISSIGTIDY